MQTVIIQAFRFVLLSSFTFLAACTGILSSKPQTVDVGNVLVHNLGTANTQFSAVRGTVHFVGIASTSGGPDARMFDVVHATTPLAKGKSMPATVRFSPSSTGKKTAQFSPSILSGQVDSTSFPLKLVGTGIAYYVWPGSPISITGTTIGQGYDFGQICISTTSTKVLTIANSSANPIALSVLDIAPITPTLKITPATFTVPANGTINITVSFSPSATKQYNSTFILRTTPGLKDRVGIWIRGEGINC